MKAPVFISNKTKSSLKNTFDVNALQAVLKGFKASKARLHLMRIRQIQTLVYGLQTAFHPDNIRSYPVKTRL